NWATDGPLAGGALPTTPGCLGQRILLNCGSFAGTALTPWREGPTNLPFPSESDLAVSQLSSDKRRRERVPPRQLSTRACGQGTCPPLRCSSHNKGNAGNPRESGAG